MPHPLDRTGVNHQVDSPHSNDNINPLAYSYLIETLDSNSRVLEIGCSTGALGHSILQARAGLSYFGIEPCKKSSELAGNRLTAVLNAYLSDDALLWSYIRESINPTHLVFCDVIEHIQEPFILLKKLLDYCCNLQSVIITLPNIASFELYDQLSNGLFEYSQSGIFDSTHLRFFTIRSACRLLESLNLQVASRDNWYLMNEKGRTIYSALQDRSFRGRVQVGRFTIDIQNREQASDLCSYGYMIVGHKSNG